MFFNPHALKIYVDGNCWENPGGAGGFAARVEYPSDWLREDEVIQCAGYYETTNNRMELRACIFAHEWALERIDRLGVQRFQVVTVLDFMLGMDTHAWPAGRRTATAAGTDGQS